MQKSCRSHNPNIKIESPKKAAENLVCTLDVKRLLQEANCVKQKQHSDPTIVRLYRRKQNLLNSRAKSRCRTKKTKKNANALKESAEENIAC